MAADPTGSGRKPANGPAVSSGDSSFPAQPAPVPPSADSPPGSYDVTLVPTPTPTPNDVTIAGPMSREGRALASIGSVVIEIGTVLGGRYEIKKLLGMGGMGAVYQAQDRELDRPVGLKVIRPDLASNPEILARFKRELILARQITHRNIIRIFDLNEADGMKFITMEYIDGEDLRGIFMRQNKLAPEVAVDIILQVCQGLAAAHAENVIHRDLKPSNIMRDASGRVVVMDFGLARTMQSDGMTQTGLMIGTMEYMSPEQAMGVELDARSDLFALGLIFYEALSGDIPFKAESAIASLVKRTVENAKPLRDRDATIPEGLSSIVSKCLEREPAQRYASSDQIIEDLHAWRSNGPLTHVGKASALSGASLADATMAVPGLPVTSAPPVKTKAFPLKWAIIGTTVVVLAGGATFVERDRIFGPSGGKSAVAVPATSLAIVPFRNASGDPSLDWLGSSVAEMLSTEIGQSNALRTVSSDRVHQVVSDLQIKPSTQVDSAMVSKIAEFSSADIVVSGQYARFGEQIRLDATLRNLRNDQTIPLKVEATNEREIPAAIVKLADAVRHNLSFSSDVIKELEASSFQPSSKSPIALREYNQGLQLHREGKNLEALTHLESATQHDPEFGLAYSGLAQTYSDLGYDSDAERASRKAVDLAQKLPAAEKYLIQANHARIMKDTNKAIESYQTLAKTLPGNTDVQYELGGLYISSGDYEKARPIFTRILHDDPKNIKALWQMGAVEIMSDHAQAAIDPLTRAMTLAIEVDNQEQKALVMHALGVAYRLLNKPDDAMRNYLQSMEINKKLGLKRSLAVNYTEIAQVQTMIGKPDEALKSYAAGLAIQQEIGAKKESGDTLLDIGVVYENKGDYDKALENYKDALQVERDAADQNYEALCLNNIGTVYLAKGDTENALSYLQQALQLREKLAVSGDIAQTLSHLGDVYTSTNQYDKALSTYMRSLELWRKSGDAHGAASVSHSIGLIFQQQARFDAAVSSMQDAEKGYRSVGDRSRDMAETLIDLARTLSQTGSPIEATKLLLEANGIAEGLKNESVRALVLNAQGDLAFYQGDSKAAQKSYEDALRAAGRGKEKEKTVLIKLNLARLAIAQGRPANAVRELPDQIAQANRSGLRFQGLEGSLDLAQAMINGKDYDHARQLLEDKLSDSEKWGLKLQTARIHYLLAESLRLSGNTGEATSQYHQAKGLFDDLRKQSGFDHLFDRADLKPMYSASSQ
jgi:tetratricopeptide (TPR) repeat protein